ncbi:hypothetical protein NL676_026763 [Syzygium grande]|nr:hypothetical protein NL676_026763 [Syzygium grande]
MQEKVNLFRPRRLKFHEPRNIGKLPANHVALPSLKQGTNKRGLTEDGAIELENGELEQVPRQPVIRKAAHAPHPGHHFPSSFSSFAKSLSNSSPTSRTRDSLELPASSRRLSA